MKRRILSLIATLFLTLGVTLSGCSNTITSSSSSSNTTTTTTTSNHEHTYSSSYEHDDTYHWHPSTCGHDVRSDEEKHTFTSTITDPTYEQGGYTTYTCPTCGYSYIDNETNSLPITITWKNYDGSILEVDNNVPYGNIPSYDGDTPIKESNDRYNYTFAGWTPEVEPVSKDATYTAVFTSEEITYTIDFDLNDGTSSSYKGPIEVTTFSKDIFFFDCIKEDWQFRGWEYNGEKIFDEKGNQLKNVTLVDNMIFKAIYSQTVKLTITTNMPEAGTITGEGEYPYNTYVDVSATPIQGYEFVGWYYQDALLSNNEDYKYMMWDKDIILEARFCIDSFTMDIYSNNEEHGLVLLKSSFNNDYLSEYSEQREYLSEVTIVAYSKTDVRFLGWYDEDNNLVTSNAVYTFAMPNYDYTLEARWDYFKINYNLNGGVNNPNNVDGFSIEDDEILLYDPSREDKDFVGWKYNGEFIDKVDSSIINQYKEITLEAVWSIYTYEISENDDGKYAVIAGFDDSSITDIVIPETVASSNGEIIVKSIANEAFDSNDNIVSVAIPDSVTTIGEHAFSSCFNLKTVTISENSQLTTIGSYAFSDCSSLTSIFIPDSVTTIGREAFRNCSNLTIYCEASSRYYDWDYSWNYSNRPVVWSYSGESGAYGDFTYGVSIDSEGKPYITITYYTGSSTNIVIPSSINVNGEDISVKTIADNVFYNNHKITSIAISDSVTSIGEYAFFGCSNLTTVTFGKNSELTTIGNYAFNDCSSLNLINIPNSVTSIGYYAFGGCSNLTTITISENSQLTTIGSDAFRGCSSLTSIFIPDSVTTIGYYAFCDCYNLTTVTFGENSQLTTIGIGVFFNCTYLASIYIPNSVTSIGNIAFGGCSKLTTITISENSQLTTIGEYAFTYCRALNSIYIPDSVTIIGGQAFEGCYGLIIYCEVSSKPSGWDVDWDSDVPSVRWNITYDEYLEAIS